MQMQMGSCSNVQVDRWSRTCAPRPRAAELAGGLTPHVATHRKGVRRIGGGGNGGVIPPPPTVAAFTHADLSATPHYWSPLPFFSFLVSIYTGFN
jgi:hypothetical protein